MLRCGVLICYQDSVVVVVVMVVMVVMMVMSITRT
jgi:hypothetical protein